MRMKEVFADSGYWIARFNPRDDLHNRALEAERMCVGAQVVTSDMVLGEFLNYCAGAPEHIRRLAHNHVKALRTNSLVIIVRQSRALFDGAFESYGSYIDKAWSFVDCASFQIMQQRGISHALAHDHHF